MQRRWTWMILILIALASFWGCSDDDDNPVTPGKSSFQVMAEAGTAYINDSTSCPGTISAATLHDNLDAYTVIDIRREDAYLAGHIPGAVNSSLATLVSDLTDGTIPAGKPYVVACYSGQSAGHAKIAMEMLGHEVYTLLFGMSSWSEATRGPWDGATVNATEAERNQLTSPETDNNNGELVAHDFPVLTEPVETVVSQRAAKVLADGFKGIEYETISANPDMYFVVNYFGQADYEGTGSAGVPGHIPGAYQFTPYASMGWGQMLENLPTDMPIVVYCWTGQHSSQITAYLNMLGYNAYSLSFGSNKLFYDSLTAHKWTDAAYNDFELEVGSAPTGAFAAMATAGAAYVNDSASCPGTIAAATLHDNLDAYTVIDIRREDAFLAGHIPGAVNSSLATLVSDLTDGTIPTGKPYVVACYSGQSAGHAKIAMEMLGYDVYTLLFGMSSWSEATRGPWDNATVNAAYGERNLLTNPETTNNNDDLVGHEFPALSEPVETVVDQRAARVLADGFKGIDYATLSANPDMYFVVNYFGQADYEGTGSAGVPGHIPGAYQFTPYASMAWDEMLAHIPTDMPVVVYCWTGQHSSQITAYLNMLGYDAYSLTYGSNKLFYDSLTAHKWTAAAYNDFELEVGSTPTPAFAAVATVGAGYVNDSASCPGVIAAATLHDNLDYYTVIDIRSQAAYDAGHIPGAVHSSLGTLVSDLTDGTIPTGKPYVVACYSGQSAGHAKIAMEMLGYEVYSLLFGMSSWAAATRGPWDDATVNAAYADRNLLTVPETQNNNGDLDVHAFPELAGDAGTAVATAVDDVLAGGFKGIGYETISANPDMYFVVNYFGQADYEGTGSAGVPGHIPGAYQFTPYASMGWDEMLAHIPTDMPVVVYCWTGQHSSQITAYLNMLGYDAYSLTYGSNKLFYDSLTAHKWTAAAYNDFDLEPTPTF